MLFVVATPGYDPAHDDRRYDRLACALIVGGQYPLRTPDTSRESCGSMPSGPNEPTAFRPPGYPSFLAAVYVATGLLPFDRWTVGRTVNALLGTLAVGLLGLIAFQTWGRRVALVAMVVAAVDVPLILVGGSLLSETLFVTLTLAAVATAMHARVAPRRLAWAAGVGVLIGLSTLTRPTGLVLVVPLGLAVAARRPRAAAVLLAATVLTIAPWTVRNAVQMHTFIPVSSFVGSWLGGTYNEQARTDPRHPGSSQPRVYAFADLDGVREAERQRELTRRAVDYAVDHPGYVPAVVLHNTMRMLNLEGADWWRSQGDSISLPRWSADAGAYAFSVLALLALLGALTPAARGAPGWLWLAPILLFAGVVLAGSEIRYRAPVEPFLALLAALAITSLWPARAR